MAKSRCGTCGEWFEDEELDEHLRTHLEQPELPVGEPVPLKCPDCRIDVEAYHGVPFTVGRGDVASRFLVGVWAELDRDPLLIDLYVCPQCGRIQHFASEKTRSRLRQTSRKP